jgi:AraC-like DNA-binding protein
LDLLRQQRAFNRPHSCSSLALLYGYRTGDARYNPVKSGTPGFAVGYESVTQFNREYKRFFGSPPHQDVNRRLQLKL